MNPVSRPMIKVMDWVEPELLWNLCRDVPHVVWLDSSDRYESGGRFSYLALDPQLVMRINGNVVHYMDGARTFFRYGDPFRLLAEEMKLRRPAFDPDPGALDIPFFGGVIGYFGYGLLHAVEKIPRKSPGDFRCPDGWFGFYDTVLAFDHLDETMMLIFSRQAASSKVEALIASARRHGGSVNRRALAPVLERGSHRWSTMTSDFTADGFASVVRKAQEYIRQGDIYQVNLSQRFRIRVECGPQRLYSELRQTNPAPYSAWIHAGDFVVLSSSPECFLTSDGESIQTRPIKGTHPRSADPHIDFRLRSALAASEKDRAEHIMIVDLERNDLGKICRYGSVRVEDLLKLEAHPSVWHLVSTVKGDLVAPQEPFENIRACFPGGSITGAPKPRAMEIISELEPVARGVYTGSIGYIGWNNTMNLSIAIRTLVWKGQEVCFHVGGGIVADSVPELEYEETLDKAEGMVRALQQVGELT